MSSEVRCLILLGSVLWDTTIEVLLSGSCFVEACRHLASSELPISPRPKLGLPIPSALDSNNFAPTFDLWGFHHARDYR